MRRLGTVVSLISVLLVMIGCSGGSTCTIVDETPGDGVAVIECSDGTSVEINDGVDGTDGTDGTIGIDGTPGTPGLDGTSCTVRDGSLPGERVIDCDGVSVSVFDGEAGTNSSITGPGLEMEVREVGIDAAGRPYAVLRFTDSSDPVRPLDRTGGLTQGPISASFAIAHLNGSYISYITRSVTVGTRTATQPTSDSGGTWTEIDRADGIFRYDFGTTLPSGFSMTETHRIGIWATRTFDGVRYVANAIPTFRPDTMPVTDTRDIISNDACNTCHSPIRAHGGSREDVGLCVTCHGPGYTDPDTGNSIEFTNMVHRIHRGAALPSVVAGEPWEIIGYMGSVHDYTGVHFPQDIRNCETCHAGPDGGRWNTTANMAACAACHDDRWFAAGAPPAAWMRPHSGGVQADGTCGGCHGAAGSLSPIVDAHFTKWQRPSAARPEVTIHSATLTGTRTIAVDFSVSVNGTARDLLSTTCPTNQVCTTASATSIVTTLSSLSAIIAGPTTDYLFNTSRTLTNPTQGAITAVSGTPGRFIWTSVSTVDEIATAAIADTLRTTTGIDTNGTWAVGIQATVAMNGAPTAPAVACTGTTTTTCTAAAPAPMGGSWACVASVCTERFTYAADNPVGYLAITDPTPVPRREVVVVDRCNACHEQLMFHGGSRTNPELCIMCHNSTFDTIDRMPAPAGTQVRTNSASFAYFVHRIHTGEEGVTDARYYSPRPAGNWYGGGNLYDFGEVRFPADRLACDRCHVDMTTTQDLASMQSLRRPRTRLMEAVGPLPLGTGRNILATFDMGATSSACTGCHDAPGSIAHTETMTSALGVEACTTCHAVDREFGVDTVHARPEYAFR